MVNYKESTGNFWKPEKAEEFVEGLYLNKEENVGANNSTIYYIELLDGTGVTQLWGTTILDQRMMPVKFGQQVRITYKGLGEKGKGGKQAPHVWKVEYGDPDEDTVETAHKVFDVDGDIK